MKPQRAYSIAEILNRANDLGIALWVSNGEIQASGPAGTLTDLFYRVIAAHRQELLTVLPSPLCAACLDEDRETRATWEGPHALMFCEAHRPAQAVLLFS